MEKADCFVQVGDADAARIIVHPEARKYAILLARQLGVPHCAKYKLRRLSQRGKLLTRQKF